jgi:hypothetical protein
MAGMVHWRDGVVCKTERLKVSYVNESKEISLYLWSPAWQLGSRAYNATPRDQATARLNIDG